MVVFDNINISPMFSDIAGLINILTEFDKELRTHSRPVPIVGEGLPIIQNISDEVERAILESTLSNLTNGVDTAVFDYAYLVDKIVIRCYASEDDYNDDVDTFAEIDEDFSEIIVNVAEPQVNNQ